MATLVQRLKKNARTVGKKVVDFTSDILSAPARTYHGLRSRYYNQEADRRLKQNRELRRLREMDEAGVPDKGNESDPLFRYRASKAIKKTR